jgi:hypothetical protein
MENFTEKHSFIQTLDDKTTIDLNPELSKLSDEHREWLEPLRINAKLLNLNLYIKEATINRDL